jgi:hypothetical protein
MSGGNIPGVQYELLGVQYELLGSQEELPGVEATDDIGKFTPPENSDTDNEEDTPPPLQTRDGDEDSDDKVMQSRGGVTHWDSEDDDVGEREIPDDEVYHPDTMTPSVQSTYGLRPRRAQDYSHLHANIVNHTMTQYSINKGMRKFKVKVEQDVEKELEQLHLKETFAPVEVRDLTPTQKRQHSNLSCF